MATAPGTPAADKARLYVADSGAGMTARYVKFADGSAQQLAVQP